MIHHNNPNSAPFKSFGCPHCSLPHVVRERPDKRFTALTLKGMYGPSVTEDTAEAACMALAEKVKE